MTHLYNKGGGRGTAGRFSEGGQSRPVLLAISCFVLGAGVSGLWVYRNAQSPAGAPRLTGQGEVSSGLTMTTLDVLDRARSPVELRFYGVFGTQDAPPAYLTYAGRIDNLLALYEAQGKGRIRVKRIRSGSVADQEAARAEGLRPFQAEEREASYLGLVVAGANHTELLPRLEPDWEHALEADLTRAIARVIDAVPRVQANAAEAQALATAEEEVKGAIPDLNAVSLEEGSRALREAALAEYRAAAQQMGVQINEARERLARAQQGGSDAEQGAAVQHLQAVQAAQTKALQEIAARLQDRITAWERLKGK